MGGEKEIGPPGEELADGMKCHDAIEKRENSDKSKDSEDLHSRREKEGYAKPDLDTTECKIDNAEQGGNLEDKTVVAEGSGGVIRGQEERVFGEKGRRCGEEESKAEEISKTEDEESCEKNTKGVTKYEGDKGTEEKEGSDME